MAEHSDDERTEEPTQQRREDFRKGGQVVQSKEFGSAIVLLSILLAIWLLGRFFLQNLLDVFQFSFGDQLVKTARGVDWIEAGRMAFSTMMWLVAPMAGLFWLVAFASQVVQTGFLINEEALQFRPERLNPLEGLKKIFSLRSAFEGFKAIVKLCLVGVVVWLVLRSEVLTVPKLMTFSVEQTVSYLGEILFKLLGGVGALMLVLAAIDFFFQKWDLEKKMRMTRQEIKEEHKSREGDPLIKARIKRVQREMANKRMMQEVPKADVIVTNPTHISVALKYDATMVAPKIIAMGADLVAAKIREIAKEHSIPIVENKPLARAIFKTLKVGHTIPRELYTAVAEVLSFVYKLKNRGLN
ncbi:MAG: flagellar biosynthesis protein FlhB [Bdellovibrionales bacterium]|nr:flagellar biosynthesis protein FlhB [Bdellovibrionales bacterium]